jgi:ferredoxin-NADP reductase/ferredoxin
MASLLVSHHRPGFYLRVIQEGVVQAGDDIVQIATGRHRLTVKQIDGLLYLPKPSRKLLVQAVDEPALSPGWQQSFRELLDSALAPGRGQSIPVVSRPAWTGFRPFTVTRTVDESPVVRSLQLTDESGADLPAFRAGQYVTLRLTIDGVAVVRSYSVSGRPDARTYRISVKREDHGTASRYLHDGVRVGDVVDVAAPRGDFVLKDGDEPVVLLSAGIGITPVLSMLSALVQTDPDRAVWWLHVARTRLDYGLSAEVDQLLAALPRSHAEVWLTRESVPQRSGAMTRHGRPDADALRTSGFPTSASVYLCGPAPFMSAMASELIQLGCAPERIHSELFGALPASTPGIAAGSPTVPHAPVRAVGGSGDADGADPADAPMITFARSGLSTPWSAHFRTLLEFAEACDVPVRWSCRTGVCHSCVTGLLSGSADYVDEPLDPPDESSVLLCCARPETDLVLDA